MNDTASVHKRPAVFRALGDGEPPPTIMVRGRDYTLDTLFKHDSWAATAVYRHAGGGKTIAKFNRTQSALLIPLAWIGRRLAARESWFLRRLAHLDLVPDDLGPVSAGGAILPNAVARSYIDGEAFQHAHQVGPAFFAELEQLLAEMHACGIAYVDLHKRENVMVDRAGRPHLIDFQVSYALGDRWPGNGRVARWLLRQLQEMDGYHVRKHVLRCIPETLSPEERRRYERKPALIRAHRKIGVPLRSLRRRLLVALGIRDKSGKSASEFEPEIAHRPPTQD